MIDAAKSYSDYEIHARAGRIIRDHSENRIDIREVIRRLIPWQTISTMLDLGCGYGWFEDAMEAPVEVIVGVDALEANGPPFLRAARRLGRDVRFVAARLPEELRLKPDRYDLVICCYALYFFPEYIGHMRDLLESSGTFVVATHSSNMLGEAARFFKFTNLRKIIGNFSAENGEEILRRYFDHIRVVDYPNRLVFRTGDEKDLIDYIDFKKDFVKADVDPMLVRDTMLQELSDKGEMRFNKNDRIFVVTR